MTGEAALNAMYGEAATHGRKKKRSQTYNTGMHDVFVTDAGPGYCNTTKYRVRDD